MIDRRFGWPMRLVPALLLAAAPVGVHAQSATVPNAQPPQSAATRTAQSRTAQSQTAQSHTARPQAVQPVNGTRPPIGFAAASDTDAAAPLATLSLGAVIASARTHDFGVRATRGQADASAGRVTASLAGVLPSVHVESGVSRTTDPLNAFGSTLRQRNVVAASFSPSALNNPQTTPNTSAALVAEVPLVNIDAWRGRRAATEALAANESATEWSARVAELNAANAWLGAVLAAEKIETFRSAVTAAAAHVRQGQSQLDHGLVTKSDVLLAQVRLGQAQARLEAAVADAAIARLRLALAMGTPADTAFTLPLVLPTSRVVLDVARSAGAESSSVRSDVRASELASEAAMAAVGRARAQSLPRVNAVGRLDWNDRHAPFGGTNSWTVGLVVSWAPFTAATFGDTQSARGDAASAQASLDASRAGAALEQQQARAMLTVATSQLAIAERAVEQSAEAHRIVARKYDGGIATVTELLDAAAIETETRLAFADARYRVLAAAAAQLKASGHDLSPLATIDN